MDQQDRMEKALEAAARALCRYDGHPENIKYEGKPMWKSYLPPAAEALSAAMPYIRPS